MELDRSLTDAQIHGRVLAVGARCITPDFVSRRRSAARIGNTGAGFPSRGRGVPLSSSVASSAPRTRASAWWRRASYREIKAAALDRLDCARDVSPRPDAMKIGVG